MLKNLLVLLLMSVACFGQSGTLVSGRVTSATTVTGTAVTDCAVPVSNVALTTNVVTITAQNAFLSGQSVVFGGLVNAAFLNGQTVTITTASNSSFTAPFVHANYSSTSENPFNSYANPITVAGEYYLSRDISSAGSCLGLRISGIRLNLNGHSITYGTSSAGWTYTSVAEAVVRSVAKDGNNNGIDTLSLGTRYAATSQSRGISITKISDTNGGAANYTKDIDYTSTILNHQCGWSGLAVIWCSAQISNVALTSNVVTVTAQNTFYAGQKVTFGGLSGASFLNGTQVTVATANSTSFTASVVHANYSSTSENANNAYAMPGPVAAATYYVDYTYAEPICAICSVATFDVSTTGDLSALRFSNTLNNTVICCGTIIQSAGVPSYSSPIRLGQQNNTVFQGRNQISNMTINFNSTSAAGIYCNSCNNFSFYNNRINNTGTLIYNRSAEESMSIYQSGGTLVSGPSWAVNNVIVGGPQGGIRLDQNNSKMLSNMISLTATFTNAPALYPYGNNIEVAYNTVDCASVVTYFCRGIIVQGDGAHGDSNVIHHNTGQTRDNNQNYEYATGVMPGTPGCELFGNYGIQIDTATNTQVYNNDWTAYAWNCDGRAFRITGTVVSTNNVSHNNTWRGYRQFSTTKRAIGLSVNCASNLTSTDDTFIADTYPVLMDIDGAKNILLIRPTIQKGPTFDANYSSVYIEDKGNCSGYGTSGDLTVRDPIFANGATVTDYTITSRNSGTVPFDYFVQWTYSPTYTSNSAPLVGATVTMTDTLSNVIFTGTTDVNGQVSGAYLNQFRGTNTTTGQTQENRNPYNITVTKGGCSQLSYSLTITATLSENKVVSCP